MMLNSSTFILITIWKHLMRPVHQHFKVNLINHYARKKTNRF
jgi:hypothetical protein